MNIKVKNLSSGITIITINEPKTYNSLSYKNLKDLFPLLRIGNNEKWPSFFKFKGNTYIVKIYKKND